MRKSLVRPAGRGGFTLVELMIVIAIIGLLVAILAAAVAPLLSKGGEMTTRNDINQMGIALQSFKSQFGFYPPSLLVLCEKQSDYSTPSFLTNNVTQLLLQDSQYYLTKMFSRLSGPPNNPGPWNNPQTFVDWNQDGQYSPPVLLTGDQCLVFFLGGIQTNLGVKGVNGFSTNPQGAVQDPNNLARFDPLPPGTSTPNGPYFDFKSDRLTLVPNSIVMSPAGRRSPNGYFSYLDGYKQTAPDGSPAVYAYFSSGRTRNNYNRYLDAGTPFYSDCLTLATYDHTIPGPGKGVFPYASVQSRGGNRYYNPETYQILSPGKDGVFGLGSAAAAPGGGVIFNTHGYAWTPDTAKQMPTAANALGWGDGRDDITNFNGTLLGKQ